MVMGKEVEAWQRFWPILDKIGRGYTERCNLTFVVCVEGLA